MSNRDHANRRVRKNSSSQGLSHAAPQAGPERIKIGSVDCAEKVNATMSSKAGLSVVSGAAAPKWKFVRGRMRLTRNPKQEGYLSIRSQEKPISKTGSGTMPPLSRRVGGSVVVGGFTISESYQFSNGSDVEDSPAHQYQHIPHKT